MNIYNVSSPIREALVKYSWVPNKGREGPDKPAGVEH